MPKPKKTPPQIKVTFKIPAKAKVGECSLVVDALFDKSHSKAKQRQWCQWIDDGLRFMMYGQDGINRLN